ncbi:hypothetical protein CANCADRAFT_148493 [Tortispora caseinolytica NRRL Y-17796]|uniref:Cyclin-like domain-containing protein n=1 Tax=Tortispora caseinolytica NRRL Y-17796 TaxID=767744 RepID=A0A1E4TBZ8_9ASCO|nr:hypothetical protein CANCADRAFT_148493 [Tortispora caseinolytica NRRL Y-17796]
MAETEGQANDTKDNLNVNRFSNADVEYEGGSPNTNSWLFTLDELHDRTPSRLDGISYEGEVESRFKGINFIIMAASRLRLPHNTIFAASCYFHRFYIRKSFRKYHQYDIAATCLFIAAKSEETARRVKDVVIVCAKVAQKNDSAVIDEQSKEFWRWRDMILFNELVVLETICFDLEVANPYDILQDFVAELKLEERSTDVCRSSWKFLNDTCRSMAILAATPRELAVSAIYWGGVLLGKPITDEPNEEWYLNLKVPKEKIEIVCALMADAYKSRTGEQKYGTV